MRQYASNSTLRPTAQVITPPAGIAALYLRLRRTARAVWKHRWLYLLLLPPLAYYFVFRYVPIYNAQIAFKDFRPLLGVEGSPWIGFEHFDTFFKSFYFNELIFNTVVFSALKLVLGVPVAII